MNDFVNAALDKLANFLGTLGTRVLSAVLIFVIGYYLISLVIKFLKKRVGKSKLDPALHMFILSVVRIGLVVLLAVACADTLNIPIASFITALGAAGLALSLALQDSLANLAGGVFILFTRPFSLGDFVEIGNTSGTVKEIGLVHTVLHTLDNKKIMIPNSDISKSKILNYSAEENRRLDLTFSIGYDNDIDRAKQLILDVVTAHPMALSDPAPLVRVCAHAASSIDIACRVWVENKNYWDLNFDLLEQVKKTFDQNGIHIPYPQVDVHMK